GPASPDEGRGGYPYASGAPRAPADRFDYETELPPSWRNLDARSREREPEELFPAESQGGASWPEPDLASEVQVAAEADAPPQEPRHARTSPEPGEQQDQAKAGQLSGSVVRSSGVMAIGTLASRVTGFLRTAVLLYALGTHHLGDAYNLANTLPNAVYNLA